MHSNGEELHPNWLALATVHLPLKRFIKADSGERTSTSDYTDKREIVGVNGTEAKEFYEQVLSEKSTSTAQQRPSRKSKRAQISSFIKKEEFKQPYDKHKFFLFAQQNDTAGLRSFHTSSNELNHCDEFGWTALMVAACEGAIDAVKTLLLMGADKNIKDRKQNNALELAKRKGHNKIVEILESDLSIPTVEKKPSPRNSVELSQFFCEICQLSFSETTVSAHQTSTVHQFNLKSSRQPNKLERFNIPNKNRGLQLMVKQGWDKESGLGPSQNGRLYPVKTVIRNQRTGLGVEQPPARVTHFEAFDLRATQRRPPNYCTRKPNRNDIRREKIRDWKRNRRLRNELS